jgi:hypothetical protein
LTNSWLICHRTVKTYVLEFFNFERFRISSHAFCVNNLTNKLEFNSRINNQLVYKIILILLYEQYFVASLNAVFIAHWRINVIYKYNKLLFVWSSIREALSVYNVSIYEFMYLTDIRSARKIKPLHSC